MELLRFASVFFFFNDTATTEIYTLSLHDALPISSLPSCAVGSCRWRPPATRPRARSWWRSEEHTSELQSQSNLVCRLLLEKKKQMMMRPAPSSRGPTRQTATRWHAAAYNVAGQHP